MWANVSLTHVSALLIRVSHWLVLFPLIRWSGKYFLQNETASTGATEMQLGALISAEEKRKGSRGSFVFYVQPDIADMVLERCLQWSCAWETKYPTCTSQHAEMWAICLITWYLQYLGKNSQTVSLLRTWWKPTEFRFFLVNAGFSLQVCG